MCEPALSEIVMSKGMTIEWGLIFLRVWNNVSMGYYGKVVEIVIIGRIAQYTHERV